MEIREVVICPADGMPLAMSYTPMQPWEPLYNDANALLRGTVFPALDLPFEAAEE